MQKTWRFAAFVFVVAGLVLAACGPATPLPSPTAAATAGAATATPIPSPTARPAMGGPSAVKITGEFDYTNDIITTYYVEHAVALVDMYGFVTRNRDWEIPVASQVLGYLKLDPEVKHGTYEIQLPARPEAHFADVDHNGHKDKGVQIFAVSYWPNLTGGPYAVGDDRSYGWPGYLASMKTDSENQDEVIGGKLVVWAPDNRQEFPTGFGPDGKLFTKDDPVAPIPAGYTIVDLDQKPFKFIRTEVADLTLYEPKEAAIKDFSKLSYTEAFDKLFAFARKEYAFNGFPEKQPNWDALYRELKPRVEAAQKNNDPNAFWLALRDFTWAFHDGHVGLSMTEYGYQQYMDATSGGYGFAIRRMDDGRYLVVYVTAGGPAEQAGIQKGAIVSEFNGQPIDEALKGVRPWSLPMSTDWALRYQQARYLLRAHPGDKATVTFINPGAQQPKTVSLTAVAERDSFNFTSIYHNAPRQTYLPVDYRILDSGVGYIRINSNYDDLGLIIRLFARALKQFQAKKVPGLIIDMRYNSGGAPLGLAGFFTKKTITLGQLEYYSDKTGKFEPEGEPEKFLPNEEQYHFNKLAVLVGPGCYSACELEAYGFSKVPGAMVVGEYPTSGTEAEVSRGQIKMPDDLSMQIPTGRFVNPDGSLFLEGQGVQPTLRVPLTPKTLLQNGDVVLKVAEEAILKPAGAGMVPSGPPAMVPADKAESILRSGIDFLEDLAREKPSAEDLAKPGTFTYTVPITDPAKPVTWAYGWCAHDQATLKDNLKHIRLTFTLDGKTVSADKLASIGYQTRTGLSCRLVYAVLKDWPAGEHHLSIKATFTQKINDGQDDYPAGDYILAYNVYVKP